MTHAPVPAPDITDALLETAGLWRQRMDAPDWDAAANDEFETWLLADERHARAYARAAAVWDVFDEHAAAPEMILARRNLLDRAQRLTRRRSFGPGGFVRLPGRRALAAAVAAVAVLGLGAVYLAQRGAVYETGLGERHVATLSDGSRVSLDALTRVAVHYSKGARRLELLKGQARFDVAHDVGRPFSVRARDRTVVATGTAFNIDIMDPKVRVTLIQGRVLVLGARGKPAQGAPSGARASAPPPIELTAGEQLVAAQGAPAQVVAHVDLRETTAWQQGKLIFDQAPLADAVLRVNRYSDRKIEIGDPAAAAVRVSGVFDAGDTNAFLGAVTNFLPVTVTDGESGAVLRSAPRRD